MSHPDSTLTYEDETIEDKYLKRGKMEYPAKITLIEMYKTMSLKQIAKYCGVCSSTLWLHFKEIGIDTKRGIKKYTAWNKGMKAFAGIGKDAPHSDAYIEKMSKYPNGRAYDNLFNADMRRLMIEKYGATSAEFTTIEELRKENI